jgi:hypothetical protein
MHTVMHPFNRKQSVVQKGIILFQFLHQSEVEHCELQCLILNQGMAPSVREVILKIHGLRKSQGIDMSAIKLLCNFRY